MNLRRAKGMAIRRPTTIEAVLDHRAIQPLVRMEASRPRLVKASLYQSNVKPLNGNPITVPSLNEKM